MSFNKPIKAPLENRYTGKNMSKILEKALKDAIKENKCTIGTKEVMNSLKTSKLILLSKSVEKNTSDKIQENAKKEKVPMVQFEGSSVALGRLCGLQFRVSSVSFTSLSEANIKSILKESGKE